MNTIFPTQIGYTPRSSDGSQPSQLVFGKNINVNWEAVGLGTNGRPDPLEAVSINITLTQGGVTTQPLIITIVANDLITIMTNPNAPATFEMKLREVAVCEDTNNDGTADTEKRMVILGSATYLPAS